MKTSTNVDGRSKPISQLGEIVKGLDCKLTISDAPLDVRTVSAASRTILYISDFYSRTYFYNFLICRKPVFLVKALIYFLFEIMFYRFYRAILVQSEVELKYAERIRLNNCYKLTNFSSFRSAPDYYKPTGKIRYGMIATFENIYIHQVNRIRGELPRKNKLTLAGKNSEIWRGDSSICAMGRLSDVAEFYRDIDVAICISFKNFGFINKVVEAVIFKKIVIVSDGSLNELEFLRKYPFVIIVMRYTELRSIEHQIVNALAKITQLDYDNAIIELKERHGLARYFSQVRSVIENVS